jgi:anaerobic selenocysteine-containing dehydrogenase
MMAHFAPSVCPHDCPSACALEVERLDENTIGRVRGNAEHPYTKDLICAKVARYKERVHHPERLKTPLRRNGPKGSGEFTPISWDEALDEVVAAMVATSDESGPAAVWPYLYAGTMGLVQRDGIERLRNVMGYSGMERTICSSVARAGWRAGVGVLYGADPQEMVHSDVIVLWGLNAVATQIHVMELAQKARRERGTKIVVVDPYKNKTAALADSHLMLRPGTDGALACAVMNVLLLEGLADLDYLAKHTDFGEALEKHLEHRTPAWAAAITGLEEDDIISFARTYGGTRKSFIRLGYGFTRSRNGAANIHAVSCLPAITGAWTEIGGGAFSFYGANFALDKGLIEGTDEKKGLPRTLDMSQIGRVLTGDAEALCGGPEVGALFIQNTNPVAVAPESALVREGFLRPDLFVCVHEQFMTETARLADIVLPATTFLEHDDLYLGGGHGFLQAAKAVIKPFCEARSNHEVICALAKRLGAKHPGFSMSAWEIIEKTLKDSDLSWPQSGQSGFSIDCRPSFEKAHFLGGFAHLDGRFKFAPDWRALGPYHEAMPKFPDHMAQIEDNDREHPFRLITPPARNFLNTSFTECPSSRKREGRPRALIHPEDFRALGVEAGNSVRLGNKRGSVVVAAEPFSGVPQGVVVVEGVWPNASYGEGQGINTLIGADAVPPSGGAAFHDASVWMEECR